MCLAGGGGGGGGGEGHASERSLLWSDVLTIYINFLKVCMVKKYYI